MTSKELIADANALMNLEMMDAVVGGTDSSASVQGCFKGCSPSCISGCSISGSIKKPHKKTRKPKKAVYNKNY